MAIFGFIAKEALVVVKTPTTIKRVITFFTRNILAITTITTFSLGVIIDYVVPPKWYFLKVALKGVLSLLGTNQPTGGLSGASWTDELLTQNIAEKIVEEVAKNSTTVINSKTTEMLGQLVVQTNRTVFGWFNLFL